MKREYVIILFEINVIYSRFFLNSKYQNVRISMVMIMERKIYEKLLNWKKEHIKMPYMLIGARQTGKTYILKEFCKNEFENYVYINLDLRQDIKEIFEKTIRPEEIITNIETMLNIEINIENTIIFLDEIQESERAINSLKYFCESEKEYKIVCAGSLLGVKMNRFKKSFPVGKVWIEYLYPMDFEEFLKAIEEEKLLETIEQSYKNMTPMVEALHEKALKLYYEYICIGGMPAAILNYIEKDRDITKFDDEINQMIIMAYIADMSRFTENIESIRNNKIYNSIPKQLVQENKKFKYSIVEKSARAREYESSLEWLISNNMILRCDEAIRVKLPLKAYTDNNFRIYLNDTGLFRVLARVNINEIITNKNKVFKKVLIENYVAEVLFKKSKELYYWQLDTGKNKIDFLKSVNGAIIPIEINILGKILPKGLEIYIKSYSPKYSIQISDNNFEVNHNIKNVPLYAINLI